MTVIDVRQQLIYRVLKVVLIALWFWWELSWVNTLTFDFGQPRDLQTLATSIFLQGVSAGVLFLLLNILMWRLCSAAALRLSALVWKRVQVKAPSIVDLPLAVEQPQIVDVAEHREAQAT